MYHGTGFARQYVTILCLSALECETHYQVFEYLSTHGTRMNRNEAHTRKLRHWRPSLKSPLLPALLLVLMQLNPASGRLKIQNQPLALDDIGEQQFQIVAEGLYSTMAVDSTLLQTGLTISYGLSSHLVFTAGIPWQQHTFGNDSKMGQGDALMSMLLHHPRPFGIKMHLGWRTTLRLASGYKEEFAGFPSYTADRLGFENLLIWEYQRHRLKLDAWGGYFSDQAWEHQRSIWGAAMSFQLLKDNLLLFTEFGHEVSLNDKSTEQQLFAGLRGNLGLGLGWYAGIEQKRISGKEYPGLFAGISYTRQPQLMKSIESRHLQVEMEQLSSQRREALRNDTISVMSPPAGIRLALLPFTGRCDPAIAEQLLYSCQRTFGVDSNLTLIPASHIQQGLNELNLAGTNPLTTGQLQQLGFWLEADVVLTGRINECEHSRFAAGGIPWIFQPQRQQYNLSAEVTMLAATDGRQLHHVDIRQQRERALAPHLFSSPDRLVIPLDSPAAAELQQEVTDSWAGAALDALFYDKEIEWTVDE